MFKPMKVFEKYLLLVMSLLLFIIFNFFLFFVFVIILLLLSSFIKLTLLPLRHQTDFMKLVRIQTSPSERWGVLLSGQAFGARYIFENNVSNSKTLKFMYKPKFSKSIFRFTLEQNLLRFKPGTKDFRFI